MPLAVLLPIVFCVSALGASLGNAAVYEWAWNSRRVSPWQVPPRGVQRRGWIDCVPIVGWLRLRRDTPVLGGGFWLRPMLVELVFSITMSVLAWWEIHAAGLVTPQIVVAFDVAALWQPLTAGFVLHSALALLMLVASLIDFDEKTIPDEVTVPGTLIGLVLVSLLPLGHLPNVEPQFAGDPAVGVRLQNAGAPVSDALGAPLWLEPTHIAAPLEWPAAMVGGPQNATSLGAGLACYALWCFALTPRYLRLRRGLLFGLAIVLRRVVRSIRTRPLREITLGGVLWITCCWYTGGAAWQGLLTGLVGLVVSGGIVWAVRIIGSAALGREAMGFGDVTLMMMVGVYVGWQAGLIAFFVAPFAGLIIGATQFVLRRDDEIPYGPFLCLATSWIVVAWGSIWSEAEGVFSMTWVVLVVLAVCLLMLGVMLGIWRVIKQRLLGVGND